MKKIVFEEDRINPKERDRREIEELTAAFLSSGGTIKKIPFGVSGIKDGTSKLSEGITDEQKEKFDKARKPAPKKNISS